MTTPTPEPQQITLSLEEQLLIRLCAEHAKKLSREALEEELLRLVTHIKITEKVYQNMLKKAWGLG
jgi:uncharacterized protein YicC (UPF0701 family)